MQAPVEIVKDPTRYFSKQLNSRRAVQPPKMVAKIVRKLSKKVARTTKSNAVPLRVPAGLIEGGLAEAPQGASFKLDPYESEVRLDPQFAFDAMFPREQLLAIQEGVLVARHYDELKNSLREFTQVAELKEAVKAPSSRKEEEPIVVASQRTEATASVTEAVGSVEPVAESEVQSVAEPVAEPELPSETQSDPVVTTQERPQSAPVQASAALPTEVIETGKTILENIQNAWSSSSKPQENSVTTQKSSQEPPSGTEPVGRVFGKITFEKPLQDWVDSQGGHVELRLHRSGSQDPQDTFFVEYRYPEREFTWDGRQVKGNYQLVANFFKPGQSVAVAQVQYPTVLNDQSAKQMVVFHLKKNQVDDAIRSSGARHAGGVVLSGTVFEAASGDHQTAKTVSGAEIEVVGMPKWGTFKTDALGSFRIPYVNGHSEYLLSVKAAGYYSTRIVVPTFQTTGYVSINLISRDKVDTITRFFTKRPQVPEKGIVMGRVFNPDTHAPQADQEVQLSGRNGRALYFGVFPDKTLPQTTSTGLFAFFNVEPQFRSVGKVGSSAYELLNVEPDQAYYIETGRSGRHSLKGTLTDPYGQSRVVGLVKVVGTPLQVETNELGEFEIEGIELSPGVLTLEVQAEGFPHSWHTVPWSARESTKRHRFYLSESDLLTEARSMAHVSEQAHKGTVLGGANSRFFENQTACVYVSLLDSAGRKVASDHGPFPLNYRQDNPAVPLCLTRQNPGFSFYNLEPGQYLVKWRTQKGKVFRSHVIRVGADRATILVN